MFRRQELVHLFIFNSILTTMRTYVLASSLALLFLLTLPVAVIARTAPPPFPKDQQTWQLTIVSKKLEPGLPNPENAPSIIREIDNKHDSDTAACPPLNAAFPYGPANVNGTLFFGLDERFYGTELWKIDPITNDPQLVRDIELEDASIPEFITAVGNIAYYKARDNEHGDELWKSDGTEAGTALVKDIFPGSIGSYPNVLTNVNGTLYFIANDGVNGRVLWKSDGTEAGTVPAVISPINELTSITFIDYASAIGNTFFFIANDNINGQELWKSDGTESGTIPVKDINPGINGSLSSELAPVGNILYFTANDGVHGYELWKTDGTESGTVLVKDINSGGNASDPRDLTAVGNMLYFMADDGINGQELWKSDGTESGTVLVNNLYAGSEVSGIRDLASVGNTLYFFSTINGVPGAGLWKSDGTLAGTQFIKNIYSEGEATGALEWAAVNGTLYFVAFSDINYLELWQSDGTAEGTRLVQDCTPTIVEDLILTAECSEDPAAERAWKITNPNDFINYYVRYKVEGTNLSRNINVPPGDTYFTTQTVAGSNTVTLQWEDENFVEQSTTQTSDGASCEPTTMTFPTTNGSCEIAIEDFPNDLDVVVASAPATYTDFTYHKNTYVVGVTAGMRTDGKPGAWEIHSDCTIKPMRKCYRNNSSELPNYFWSGLNYRRNWRFEVTGISPDGGTIYADAINDQGYEITRRRYKAAGVPDIEPGTVVPVSWKLSDRPFRGRIKGATLHYECDVTFYLCGGFYVAGCNPAARTEPIAKKGNPGLEEPQYIIPGEEASLRIYPNPGQQHFMLDFTGGDQWGRNTQVYMYNLTGILVRKLEIDAIQQPNYQMDITELSSGMYMVKIVGGEIRKTIRIVKE